MHHRSGFYQELNLFFGRSGDGPKIQSSQDAGEYGSHRFTAQFKENHDLIRACRPHQKSIQRRSKRLGYSISGFEYR